jgi:hypothetical protein
MNNRDEGEHWYKFTDGDGAMLGVVSIQHQSRRPAAAAAASAPTVPAHYIECELTDPEVPA